MDETFHHLIYPCLNIYNMLEVFNHARCAPSSVLVVSNSFKVYLNPPMWHLSLKRYSVQNKDSDQTLP